MAKMKQLRDDFITVKIMDKKGFYKEHRIARHRFDETEPYIEDGEIKHRIVYSVSQFPVVLAYAVTMHKAHGKTFEKIVCDLSDCFTAGQAYVALSRCTSLSGLYLLNPVDRRAFMTDPEVINFYMHIQQNV